MYAFQSHNWSGILANQYLLSLKHSLAIAVLAGIAVIARLRCLNIIIVVGEQSKPTDRCMKTYCRKN